jgi:hypothetical protein
MMLEISVTLQNYAAYIIHFVVTTERLEHISEMSEYLILISHKFLLSCLSKFPSVLYPFVWPAHASNNTTTTASSYAVVRLVAFFSISNLMLLFCLLIWL